jgi:hypothetical protein
MFVAPDGSTGKAAGISLKPVSYLSAGRQLVAVAAENAAIQR